jgi:hypothetical protein
MAMQAAASKAESVKEDLEIEREGNCSDMFYPLVAN